MTAYPFKFGFTTASVQEDLVSTCFSFSEKNGKTQATPKSEWGLWLAKGGNTTLMKIWDKRQRIGKAAFDQKIHAYFGKLTHELIAQCEDAQVDLEEKNSLESGYKLHYLSIDYVIIEAIISADEFGSFFTHAVAKAIETLQGKNIETVLFLNQFSSPSIRENYSQSMFKTIAERWNEQLRAISTQELLFQIEFLREKSTEQWHYFIDRSIILGETYGGTKIIRFNLEWAEVMSSAQDFNYSVLDKYIELITYANEKNLDVLLCLHHMNNPLWINGWDNPDIVPAFTDFVGKVFRYFEDKRVIHLLNKILILNEPVTILSTSYLTNAWPPFRGLKDRIRQSAAGIIINYSLLYTTIGKLWKKNPYFAAVRHMQQTHESVYTYLKKQYPTLSLSSSQILMGVRRIRKDSLVDMIAVWQLNHGTYRWIDTLRAHAFKTQKPLFDFYAPQLYGSMGLSFKHLPTGGKNQKVLDNPGIRYKQVNGSLDDQSIFVVRLLEVASRCVEDGIRFNKWYLSDLPVITFTEFGYVAGVISNQTYSQFIMNNISQFIPYVPNSIDYMLRWAPDDNWEWDSGYMNWARFGDVNYDGTPKPLGAFLENRFNYYDIRIYNAMRELYYWMGRYRNMLKKRMLSSDYDQAMHSSVDLLSAKMRLAEAYLKEAEEKKHMLPL